MIFARVKTRKAVLWSPTDRLQIFTNGSPAVRLYSLPLVSVSQFYLLYITPSPAEHVRHWWWHTSCCHHGEWLSQNWRPHGPKTGCCGSALSLCYLCGQHGGVPGALWACWAGQACLPHQLHDQGGEAAQVCLLPLCQAAGLTGKWDWDNFGIHSISMLPQ